MPEKWTGRIVGRMHTESISTDDLSKEMGVSKAYISMILHGARKPEGIEQRMKTALDNIVQRRNS